MLRLTLWNDAETAQHTIELYNDVPVNLTYQFTEVSDINKSVGSYSQTFRIPATKQNTDFFGAVYDPNIFTSGAGLINGNYNVKRKTRAELSFNSVPLMKGYIQLKAVYLQKEHFADIEIVFLSEVVDLAKSLGENLISDLDTTAIDHELNLSNVQSSFIGALSSGNVRYGVMDKGQNWSFIEGSDTTEAIPAWSSTDGLWLGDLTPFVRAKWLIDQIMTGAGYTYDSALFDTADFQNIYLPAFNGALAPLSTSDEPEAQVAAVALSADRTLTLSDWLIEFKDTNSGAYDYSNNWDNSAYIFTAPYYCEVTFTLNQKIDPHPDTDFEIGRCKVFHNTTQIYEFYGTTQNTITMVLEAGDTISVKADKWENASSAVKLYWSAVGGDGTWLRIDSVSDPLMGQDVLMSANLPEVKQIDFLTGLQKMFNLVFVPDKHIPKHLLIEPFNDYTSTGATKDWSSKIDYTKDVVIKPTADIQSKQYDWTSSAGQDFINVLIQQSANRTYGRYRVTDPENDFETGEQVITTPFAPFIMSYIPSSQFTIHRAIDKDGNGVQNPAPKLAYWNDLTSAFGTWYLRNDSGTTLSSSTFPHFSNYSAVIAEVSDNDLNFGYEPAFIATDAHPVNTQFYRFWTAYVNELYSPEARLLTAYIKLTRADIQDFEFSDKIYIKDSYYRVLRISNFDATIGDSVQVELIKVLADIRDCADLPTGQKTDGSITFNNDAFDYGSQACCERYGYVWFPRISRCYPTSIQIQPSND